MPVTSIPTSLHNGVESDYAEPTLRPSLNPSSSGSSSSSSSSDGVPYIIIEDRSEKSPTEGTEKSANETMSSDQNIEEKPNMVLTTKQLLIICAGIAGLAFFEWHRVPAESGSSIQQWGERSRLVRKIKCFDYERGSITCIITKQPQKGDLRSV